jgi:Amt family ammonium transporter
LTIVWSVVATAVIAFIVKAVIGLRPSNEVETVGLDLSEHGEEVIIRLTEPAASRRSM